MKVKKADEMEMSINYKAARLDSIFVAISLIIWMIVDFAMNKEFPLPQFLILTMQNIIFFGSKIFMTHRITGNRDD